jgi:putative hemolysin
MKLRFSAFVATLAVGAVSVALPAMAIPVTAPQRDGMVMPVASNCYAVGQEVAAQKGGTLAKASQSTRGGQAVCVIVVLVPGKEGQRPRRAEVIVPQG